MRIRDVIYICFCLVFVKSLIRFEIKTIEGNTVRIEDLVDLVGLSCC